jgi:hypothetical protein
MKLAEQAALKYAKEIKAMLAFAEKLSPAQKFQWVRIAYAKTVNSIALIDDSMLDFLRYWVNIREVIAWRLARKFGLPELQDGCFTATNTIMFDVFLDRADVD